MMWPTLRSRTAKEQNRTIDFDHRPYSTRNIVWVCDFTDVSCQPWCMANHIAKHSLDPWSVVCMLIAAVVHWYRRPSEQSVFVLCWRYWQVNECKLTAVWHAVANVAHKVGLINYTQSAMCVAVMSLLTSIMQNLDVSFNSGLTMSIHILKMVAWCVATLCQLHSVC